MSENCANKFRAYTERITECLEHALPGADEVPGQLHEAMRYAVLNGGKRVRPLLVYASGECLGLDARQLDPPAVAIELIHAFSLVHDDLPAMDDDELRRGRPTVHRQYDEATAILAADALQPLAFHVLSTAPELSDADRAGIIAILSAACGSLGMTGGQSIDLASEGRKLGRAELETMHGMKTGALIRASVMATACLAHGLAADRRHALDGFSQAIGLAFQVRDDILDVEGSTDVIGKPAGADERKAKATWPALFGLQESKRYCGELLDQGVGHLDVFGSDANTLRSLARYIVERPS